MTDRHLARAHEQYYDPDLHLPAEPRDRPAPSCSNCNARLPQLPDRMEPWEDAFDCDGTETFHDEPYTPGLVDILGAEFEGKSYKVSVSPCGTEVGPHEPHREIRWVGYDEVRVCRACGQTSVTREY